MFGLSPNNVLSQNSKITIEEDTVVSADDVFSIISDQTDYRFIYHEDMFKNYPMINLSKGTIRTKALLKKTLSLGGYNFSLVSEETIQLSDPNRIMRSEDQQIIQGTITNKDGLPLAGASIAILNSDSVVIRGASSDFDGKYKIKASQFELLIFSYIGYKTKKVPVENSTTINVVLEENTNVLDEIVLSTGYEKISKERATGSFENINEKTLGIKTAQNVFNKIEGEVAGVLFDQAPDGTQSAVVRGISTINSVNQPLIVIDGFPVEQGLETINPNDVESITILKDAAAASIWGIRAANGVIVVVTKKGHKNTRTSVSYASNFSITSQLDLHEQRYASTSSFLDLEKHIADNQWRSLPNAFNSSNVSNGLNTYLQLNAGLISEDEANNIINGLRSIDSRQQFEDLFISDETWMQHNLGISGGGQSSSYQVSLAYNQNRNIGSFNHANRDQIIANIRNQIDLSPKLSFTGGINYSHTRNKPNGLSLTDAQDLDQYQNIIDENGNYLAQPRGFYEEFKEERSVENGYPYNWDYNLLQELENKNNRSTNSQIRLQGALNYNITDHLAIEGRYQYERGHINTKNLFNENTFTVRNLVNTFTTRNATGDIVSAIPKGAMVDFNNETSQSQSGRLQLNYNQSFKDNLHNVTALAGYEVRKVQSSSHGNRLYAYDDQSLDFNSNINYADLFPTVFFFGQRNIPNLERISDLEDRFISYYGNFSYDYDRRYTLTGSIRLDDANLFGASDEYKNIPLFSIGGKWAIHNEDFFNSAVINNLALRATYGSNGNVNNQTSPNVQLTVTSDFNTGNPFAYISNVKNPELRLERVFVTNLGLDFGLFNNRISGSIEYYERKSQELLSNVIFPSILGFNSALINAGEMVNKGLDISIRGDVVKTKSFNYNTTLNFSFNENEVTKVDVPNDTPFTYTVTRTPLVNTPLRYLYSYQYQGLNDEGDPLFLNENGELVNDVIDNVDALKYEGTTLPKFYGSWINQFTYKGFTLRALATFKFGHVFRNPDFLDYNQLPNIFGGNHFVHEEFENRWQNPGDEANTNIPRTPTTRADATLAMYSNFYKYGSQNIDDASHIRLREVVLSYQLDQKIANKIGLNGLSINLQGRNLALINFNKWDVDPEGLIVTQNKPTFFTQRPTFTIGVNANF
ncbi:SusC/RagA family TonB-linked outer membrane protein [Flavivirga amylovorans]